MKYHIEFDLDFQRNQYSGIYIALEGIDGSGKTTQVDRLVAHYQSLGKQVVRTAEPRKDVGEVGKLIQKVLLSEVKIPSVAFQYLMSAERAIHHVELILPSLKMGKVVISDRCFWSAIPYGILDRVADQTESYDFQMGEIILVAQSILSMYHQFTVPNITIYLDVDVFTAMDRLSKMHKEAELYEKADKLQKVLSGYSWLMEKFPQEIKKVNASQPIDLVTNEIIALTKEKKQ